MYLPTCSQMTDRCFLNLLNRTKPFNHWWVGEHCTSLVSMSMVMVIGQVGLSRKLGGRRVGQLWGDKLWATNFWAAGNKWAREVWPGNFWAGGQRGRKAEERDNLWSGVWARWSPAKKGRLQVILQIMIMKLLLVTDNVSTHRSLSLCPTRPVLR